MMMKTEIGEPPLPITVYFYVNESGIGPAIRVSSVIVNFDELPPGLAQVVDCLAPWCLDMISARCREFLTETESAQEQTRR